jgi:hypothetical protein
MFHSRATENNVPSSLNDLGEDGMDEELKVWFTC